MKNHLRKYVLELFAGEYDDVYVQSRLRIGMVHKRIGVSPQLYLTAVRKLHHLLRSNLVALDLAGEERCLACMERQDALEKLIFFDLALVFDTYIHSLLDEVEMTKEELENYAESLEEKVAERTRQIVEMTRRNALTGLFNQKTFYEELRREIARSERNRTELSLVYLDCDGFKKLNDHEGHQRGDEMLVAVADSMRAVLRRSDIPARYGGDEFCIILPETPVESAREIRRRLCAAFDESKGAAEVTFSMGIASTGPETFVAADQLVKEADQAMCRAKETSGHAMQAAERA